MFKVIWREVRWRRNGDTGHFVNVFRTIADSVEEAEREAVKFGYRVMSHTTQRGTITLYLDRRKKYKKTP